MQDHPIDDGERLPPTEAQEIRDQGVVLIHVLTRHPTLLTIPGGPLPEPPTHYELGGRVPSGLDPGRMFWGTRATFRTYNPMASPRIKLDPQAVEAIARRVVEILERRGLQGRELVDAAELARRFGIERSWGTRTRSNSGRSSSAAGRNHGCGSIRRSRRGCCGGLAMDRRLTRPPARVSGRVSLRVAEGAGCGCFRSTGGGENDPPPEA